MAPAQDPSDEDLLRRSSEGDEASFAALYRRWQGGLYRFALRMGGSTALAEEVVQDVFMALARGRVGFDAARGSVPGYLYGIARHKLLRQLPRERATLPMDEISEPAASPGAGGSGSPADPLLQVLRQERLDLLRDALLALPAHYREVVVLCDLNELSYEEAAAALGCAVGTVRSRLHRGRDQLATRIRSLAERRPRTRPASLGWSQA